MSIKSKILAFLANQYMSKKGPDARITKMILDTWPEDISDLVILPASNFYVNAMIKHFKGKAKGLTWYVPSLNFSIVPSGVGAPSAAMVIEALRRANVKKIIRIDVAGSLSKNLKPGDFIIPTYAIKGDCTSNAYSKTLEAEPTESLVEIIKAVLTEEKVNYHLGTIFSHDALFLESKELIQNVINQGAIAIDMETSLVYVLGKLFEIDVAALLFVSNYAFEGFEKEISKLNPAFFQAIDKSFRIISKIVKAIRG